MDTPGQEVVRWGVEGKEHRNQINVSYPPIRRGRRREQRDDLREDGPNQQNADCTGSHGGIGRCLVRLREKGAILELVPVTERPVREERN